MAALGSTPLGLDTTFTAYQVPLSAVLKWPTPNYSDPETRHWFVIYGGILEALSTFVVGARLWTRVGKRAGGLGLDDVLIVFAWVLATAVYAMGCHGVLNAGIDRHVWDVPPPLASKAGLVAWITEILFLASLCLTKISVLIFFRRLIDKTINRKLTWAIWIAIGFTIAYFFAFTFFLIFSCQPIESAWKSLNITYAEPYKCVSRKHADTVNGTLSIFSDVYSLVIPVIIVRKLRLPWARKMMLYVVFGCGLIVVGAGIARTYFISTMHTDDRRDLTWIGYDLLVWGFLEVQMAIVCASAPAMKGFFLKFGEVMSTRYGSRGTNPAKAGTSYENNSTTQQYKKGVPRSSDTFKLAQLSPSSSKFDRYEDMAEVYNEKSTGGGLLTSLNNGKTSTESTRAGPRKSTGMRPADDSRPPPPLPPTRAPRQAPPIAPAPKRGNSLRKPPPAAALPVRPPGDDFVQLNGSGIHVEQRWSVTSYDPFREENERAARRMI